MLDQYPVSQLRGVGPKTLQRLHKINIHSIFDLLLHLPRQYEDRSTCYSIASIMPEQYARVEAEICSARVVFGRRRQLVCEIKDDTGHLQLRFFHFNAQQKAALSATGERITCYGQLRRQSAGTRTMIHPEYAIGEAALAKVSTERLTPIYPSTTGLQQASFHQLIQQALHFLQQMPDALIEILPEALRTQHELPAIREALAYVHQPPLDADCAQLQARQHPMQQRLMLEELLAHQWGAQQNRTQTPLRAIAFDVGVGSAGRRLQDRLRAQCPFTLTGAQERVIAEIAADCQRSQPMMRLLQGDVGSGKTLVAAMCACLAVAQGGQVAVMVPTEILAQQHYAAFQGFLGALDVQVESLMGSQNTAQRRESLHAIAMGQAQVVVGTQALFQEAVTFANLLLVITDEQHRFGVKQRLSLQEKARQDTWPHQLIMTATPIPRSLSMVAFAHCDQSIIDELPPGRQPIVTSVISSSKMAQVAARIAQQCADGAQCYWVCPLVEESESLACQAVTVRFEVLQALLPQCRVACLHGQMPAADKTAVMQAFHRGETQVLVSTTVIEVGVDVPNASMMIIEDATRFGLAQLHQLRGRVGRGTRASYCVLLYQTPLSRQARQRLAIMREHADGFAIANEDLKMRGPGALLGQAQAGFDCFRLLQLQDELRVLPLAQQLLADMPAQPYTAQHALLHAWTRQALQYLMA